MLFVTVTLHRLATPWLPQKCSKYVDKLLEHREIHRGTTEIHCGTRLNGKQDSTEVGLHEHLTDKEAAYFLHAVHTQLRPGVKESTVVQWGQDPTD